MRNLFRDRDFLMVAGCLVVAVFQVRAQRALLRALEAARTEDLAAAPVDPFASLVTSPQPMRYGNAEVQEAADRGTFGNAFGMN